MRHTAAMGTLMAVLALAQPWLAAGGSQVSFITLGDWGGSGLGGEHAQNQQQVAAQMAQTASSAGISFVVNVGDNFYYCGITSTSDSQIQTDFENVYTQSSLMVPWYSILGNHEYGYDPDAQVQYQDPQGRWVMPAHYYTKRVQVGSGIYVSFIFLDTSPCVQEYRSSNPAGWDPCGSDFPTCAPIEEGPCQFNANILQQDCQSQLTWFQQQLQQVPAGDWLIVAGHHKLNEVNVADFVTPLEQHGFDLYLNGHTHTLDQYSLNGKASYVTSGAGAMVSTHDQEYDVLRQNASYNEVFNKKVAGFTLHTFSEDFSQLTTEYITYTGETIHSFTVQKGSGPGPSPPPSSNTCKAFGCGYKYGRVCQCNPDCKYYQDCCSDYEETCGSTGGSCKEYGCVYNRAHECQCNWACKHHGDCCSDYDSVCGGEAVAVV